MIGAGSPSSAFYAERCSEMSSTRSSLSGRYAGVGRAKGGQCSEYELFTHERRSVTHDNALTELAVLARCQGAFAMPVATPRRHNASRTAIVQLNAVYKYEKPRGEAEHQTS